MFFHRETFFLLLCCSVKNVKLEAKEELLNVFGCLMSVVEDYRDFESFSCRNSIGSSCIEDAINCPIKIRGCQKWRKQNTTKVSINIRLLSSIIIRRSRKIHDACNCEEYLIECSLESKYLAEVFAEITLSPLTTALITATPAYSTTTESNEIEELENPATNSKELQGTSYISIAGALVGGVILGVCVEFVAIMLIRRKSKSADQKKQKATERSPANPAYTISKGYTEVVVKPEGETYTQLIANQNKAYQNETEVTENGQYNDQKISSKPTNDESVYNHLHESNGEESTNHYDHVQRIPTKLQTGENGYGTVKAPSTPANTYIEIDVNEDKHPGFRTEDDEKRIYFELEKKE